MKKITWLIFLPLLVLISVALIPYWVGGQIEKTLRAQSDLFQLQWQQQAGYSYQLSHYQRDYLSSVVETRFTFEPTKIGLLASTNSSAIAPFSLTFRHQVSHAPWIDGRRSFTDMSEIETVLLPEGELEAASKFYFNQQAAFSMTSRLEWSGGLRSDGHVLPYRGRDHTGQYDVKWGGFRFSFEGDWITTSGTGHFNAPRFELSNASHGVMIGGLFGNFSRLMSPQKLPLGNGDLTLNIFQLRGEGDAASPLLIVLRDMGVSYGLLQRGALVDLSQQFEFRLLNVNGTPFNNGAFHFSFNNIDVLALQAIQQQFSNIGQSRRTDAGLLPDELLQVAQSLLPNLLAHSPVVDISKIELTTIDGMMSGRIKLGVEKGRDIPAAFVLPNDLKRLLPLAKIEIEIKLPASIIEQQAGKAVRAKIIEQLMESEQTMTPEVLTEETARAVDQMLDQLEIQNIIRREAGYFRAWLRYDNSKLYLNGVPANNFLSLLPALKES